MLVYGHTASQELDYKPILCLVQLSFLHSFIRCLSQLLNCQGLKIVLVKLLNGQWVCRCLGVCCYGTICLQTMSKLLESARLFKILLWGERWTPALFKQVWKEIEPKLRSSPQISSILAYAFKAQLISWSWFPMAV